MRFLVLVLTVLFVTATAHGQRRTKEKVVNLQNFDKKKLQFGYYIGLNSYNYKVEYKKLLPEVLVKTSPGFNIGLVADYRVFEHLNLRFEPGLSSTQRELNFLDRSRFTKSSDTLRTVKSTYIHLPLILKFSTKRLNNIRPYLLGGISTSVNLSSNQNNPDDNVNQVFRTQTNTFYYELGLGIDFYLYYFKFSPSIRGVFAISDELVPDVDPNSPWTGNISALRSRGIFINFTFH